MDRDVWILIGQFVATLAVIAAGVVGAGVLIAMTM